MALIYDDNKLRYCEHNIVELGYYGTWKHFCSYRQCLEHVADRFGEIVDAFATLWNLLSFCLLMPILPYIQAYATVTRARKAKIAELVRLATGQCYRCHNLRELETRNV